MSDTDALITRLHGTSLLPGLGADLKPRSDLTFRIFSNQTIEGADAYQSLLNGCLFRGCTLRGVRFSRCDLEQIRFSNCKLMEVSFVNIELTSGQLSSSSFIDCDFRSALLTESLIQTCTFRRCSFKQSVVRSNRFEDCEFVQPNLKGASVQLNTFRQSKFKGAKLGDCTFLNQILSECTYDRVSVNAESIGSLFGITEQDLHHFDLIYLGKKSPLASGNEELLDALEAEYERRRWFFMHSVLKLNFGRIPRALGLGACLSAVLWPASVGAPLKAGDVVFLEMIVTRLFDLRQLPALSTLLLPEKIQSFLSQFTVDGIQQSAAPLLQRLSSRLNLLLLELLEEFHRACLLSPEMDEVVQAKLSFEAQPATDVAEFINTLAKGSGMQVCCETILLREEIGSYILYVQTTLVSIAALQTALWLLNGCVTQLIEMKSRLMIMAQKRPPKMIRDRVLMPEQTAPRWMMVAIHSIFSKLTGDQVDLRQVATDFRRGNLSAIEVTRGKRKSKSRRGSTLKST